MSARTLLTGGRILTMGARHGDADSLVVEGERVLAVGSMTDVADAAAGARRIDLDGATVVPGLIDAHAHMEREGLKHTRLALKDARSIADVLATIAAAAAVTPKGEWIVTLPVGTPPYYFDGPQALAEGRMPDRFELDRVAPDHPVYIMGAFGTWSRVPTVAAVNSLALARSGLLDGGEGRCGGVVFERGSDGQPTGVIYEENERPTLEFDLLKDVPRFTWDTRLDALRRSMALYNAVGTTSIYEGHGSYSLSVGLYQRLWEQGELTVRTSLTVSPSWSGVEEAGRIMRDWLGFARGRGLGDRWLRVSGVFIGYGGKACTAALTREALPDTGWAGFVEWHNDLEAYRGLVTLAAQNDLRVHTVILENLGTVLPIFEDLATRYPIASRRWVMEHVGHLSPEDHARVKRLGIVVTTIPVYALWKNGDDYDGAPDDGNHVVPHRTLIDAGVPVAMGTDNIPISLFRCMAVCRTRTERVTGRVIGPKQRISGLEALRMCTVNAAHLSFEEHEKGRLEPGYLADLAVLSDDPTTMPAEDLEGIGVRATMVGGRFVHEAW